MNKTELIAAMAEKGGLTKVDARKAFDAFVAATVEELKAGNKVSIPGFGTFAVVDRPARMGVNPRKPGVKVKIPAKRVAKFKAGKGLDL